MLQRKWLITEKSGDPAPGPGNASIRHDEVTDIQCRWPGKLTGHHALRGERGRKKRNTQIVWWEIAVCQEDVRVMRRSDLNLKCGRGRMGKGGDFDVPGPVAGHSGK
jgi:hypothetical protein